MVAGRSCLVWVLWSLRVSLIAHLSHSLVKQTSTSTSPSTTSIHITNIINVDIVLFVREAARTKKRYSFPCIPPPAQNHRVAFLDGR